MVWRIRMICCCLGTLAGYAGTAQADDLGRLIGTIANEVVKEQMRQQNAQPRQPQQQGQPQQMRRATKPAAPAPQQPQMSAEERMAVQRALMAGGYYAGTIDGALGAGSRQAIARWQAAMGASATGYLLDQQARALIRSAPVLPATASADAETPAPQEPAGLSDTPPWQRQPAAAGAAPGQQPATATAETPPWQRQPAPAGMPPVQAQAPAAAKVPQAAAGGAIMPQSVLPEGAVIGDHALNNAMLIWVAANNPTLLDTAPTIVTRLVWAGLAPELRQNKINDPNLQRQAIGAALPAPGMAQPTFVRLERDVDIAPPWDGKPASLITTFTDIEGVTAITELQTHQRGTRTATPIWTFRFTKPFYMPTPAGLENWVLPRQNKRASLLVQIDLALGKASFTPDPDGQGLRNNSIEARVERVTLIRRPPPPKRKTDPVLPDEVLHVWTGEAPDAQQVGGVGDVAGIAQTYGGGVNGGRYVSRLGSGHLNEYSATGSVRGGGEALKTALALRGLVEIAPDRAPDVALADALSMQFLTERERLDILPQEIALRKPYDKISELALHAAMTKAAVPVRDRVIARAPDLPLPMRRVSTMYLGEYNFDSGAFPAQLDGSIYQDLPLAEAGPDFALDAPFKMSPAEAQALLDRITAANPAGAKGRELFIAVDYSLDDVTSRAPGAGPITAAELETVGLRSHIESAALYLDPGLTDKLMDLPFPSPVERPVAAATAPIAPPTDLAQTTARSLWGAFALADPRDEYASAMLQKILSKQGAGGAVEVQAAALKDAVVAEARGSYWLGATVELMDYEPQTGGFPIKRVDLRAPPPGGGDTGMAPPEIGFMDQNVFRLLSATPEQAAAIDTFRGVDSRLALLMQVRPAAVAYDYNTGNGALQFAAPDTILLGPVGADGLPDPILLQIGAPVTPAETLTPAAPTQITAPRALLLDQEGLDLLALSLDPAIYDDTDWRRMLIERLMRERWFRVEPDPVRGDLAWGSFFADPMQTPDPAQMTALMPAFRDWTMARVAALPDRLLMPRGPVPMGEPQCLGFTEVNAPAIGTHPSFVLKNAASLLGDMTAMAATEYLGTAETHRPGPDRLWVHDPNSQTQSCRYHGRSPVAPLQSQVPVDAGRVAALVGTAAMPVLAHGDDGLSATAVTLRRDVLRLEKPQGAPDKLRGVLVAAGPVEAITGWRGHTGRDMAQALALTSPDWAGPGDLATRDILGLTTGMTLAEFETGAMAHLGQAVRFVEEVPGKGMFGHARGFLNMETGEALAAIYAPRAEGQPVVAIMRRIMLPASEPGLESIKLSLTQKYGENIEEFQEGRWQWSTLPKGEDGWGVCVGGRSLIAGGRGGREGAPRLIPDGDLGQPVGSHFGSPDYWVGAGWPEMVTDRPGQLDPERCGLVVGAFVTQVDDRRMMQIWLLDRKLAGTLDAIPPPPVEAAPLKL